MQAPNESLEDFMTTDAAQKTVEPPPVRSLQPTGQVEVLKPLARTDQLVRFRAATGRMIVRPVPVPRPKGFSWYHRSLAFSGAVAVSALLLGIFAGLYAPPEPSGSQSGLVLEQQPEGIRAFQNEAETDDRSNAMTAPRPSDKVNEVRKAGKRRYIRQRYTRTPNRPQPTSGPAHLVVSEFVPTTLIIYIENGEVKTRVELQPTAIHRKKT